MDARSYSFGYREPGLPPPRADIAGLAFALAGHARTLGLIVIRIRASRVRSSCSNHLQLRDRRGREWVIRISDHPLVAPNGYDRPHFDLVSRDGVTGYELAVGFVNRVARGAEPWAPAERAPQRRGQKLRGQK